MNTNTTPATALPTAAATPVAETVAADSKPRRRRPGFRTHVRAGAGKGDVC